MSEERVAQILHSYDALNRGDFEVLASRLPPEFEFIPPPMLPEGEVYKGPEGLRRFWHMWVSAFSDFRIDVEEAIDAGDQVIVMAAVAGTGLDSGLEVKTPSFAWVWSFEGDVVVRMEAMPNRATALEAVGLSE